MTVSGSGIANSNRVTEFSYPSEVVFFRGYGVVFFGLFLLYWFLSNQGVEPFSYVGFIILALVVAFDILIVVSLRFSGPRAFHLTNSTLKVYWRKRVAEYSVPSLSVSDGFRWLIRGTVIVTAPDCKFIVFDDLEDRDRLLAILTGAST
jgi:hypothetical protein